VLSFYTRGRNVLIDQLAVMSPRANLSKLRMDENKGAREEPQERRDESVRLRAQFQLLRAGGAKERIQ